MDPAFGAHFYPDFHWLYVRDMTHILYTHLWRIPLHKRTAGEAHLFPNFLMQLQLAFFFRDQSSHELRNAANPSSKIFDANSSPAAAGSYFTYKYLIMAEVFTPDEKGQCAVCGDMVWSTEQRCKTLDGLLPPFPSHQLAACGSVVPLLILLIMICATYPSVNR